MDTFTKAKIQRMNKIKQELGIHIYRKKNYRDKNFKLKSLAVLLNISEQELREAIKYHYNCNFRDFLNLYRVKEAVTLMTSSLKRGYNLEQIAILVGFSSRQSFFNAFTKQYGISPRTFLQKAKKLMI